MKATLNSKVFLPKNRLTIQTEATYSSASDRYGSPDLLDQYKYRLASVKAEELLKLCHERYCSVESWSKPLNRKSEALSPDIPSLLSHPCLPPIQLHCFGYNLVERQGSDSESSRPVIARVSTTPTVAGAATLAVTDPTTRTTDQAVHTIATVA